MEINVLAVKESHGKNLDCPMYLAQHPSGYTYCVSCGVAILNKRIKVSATETTATVAFRQNVMVGLLGKPNKNNKKYKRRKGDK